MKTICFLFVLILLLTADVALSADGAFTFPLASRQISLGESPASLKAKFPDHQMGKNGAIEVRSQHGAIFFKFSKDRLVSVETEGGTDGPGPMQEEFNRWLTKKYGKGRSKKINESRQITEWKLPGVIVIEDLYGGSESGDVLVNYKILAR